jgi:Tol biopolymer transport system component
MPPIWSPDSRFLVFSGYNVGGKLKKIDISGGPAESLCDLSGTAIGGDWSLHGVILFGTTQGIMRVPSSSGAGVAAPVTNAARDRLHGFPAWLPDGRHFLYLRRTNSPENSRIDIGSIDSQPEQQTNT